jgi:hypothetical protein
LQHPKVEIDSSPLYELLLTLLVFGSQQNRESFRVGAQWFDDARGQASARLLRDLEALAPPYWMWHRLLVLACKLRIRSQAVNISEFLERLGAINAERLHAFLLGHETRSSVATRAVIEDAVAGNSAARRTLGKVLFPDDPEEEAPLDRFLERAPEKIKDLILSVVGGWYTELFRGEEREIAARLATEARTKRIIGSSTPSRLLRAAAIGLHYLPPRSVRRVLLVPAIISRPLVVTIRFGATRAFFYPLADESSEDEELSTRLVKIHRALADLERLRILQSLIRNENTVAALSRQLGQPVQRLTANLVILRDAGLVTLRMDEHRQTFAVRPNLPAIVFRTLQAFLPER